MQRKCKRLLFLVFSHVREVFVGSELYLSTEVVHPDWLPKDFKTVFPEIKVFHPWTVQPGFIYGKKKYLVCILKKRRVV